MLVSLLNVSFDDLDVRGVIITTCNTNNTDAFSQYDFVSRYFTPWNSIPEDPVTGIQCLQYTLIEDSS